MPKLPRFKESVRVSPSSPVRAFSGRGASLAGKDQQAFAQGVQKLGVAALKIDQIKAVQDRKIFAAEQGARLEEEMLTNFQNATQVKEGEQDTGDNYLQNFKLSSEKLREQIDTISDKEIKASLLTKSTNLEARYGNNLRTKSLARRNIVNTNLYDANMANLSRSVGLGVKTIPEAFAQIEKDSGVYLGLDLKNRQKIINISRESVVQAKINGLLNTNTDSSLERAREVLNSPLVRGMMDAGIMRSKMDDLQDRESALITDKNRRITFSEANERRVSRKLELKLSSQLMTGLSKLKTPLERQEFTNETLNLDMPPEVRAKLRVQATYSDRDASRVSELDLMARLYATDDVNDIANLIHDRVDLIPEARARLNSAVAGIRSVQNGKFAGPEVKNQLKFIVNHFPSSLNNTFGAPELQDSAEMKRRQNKAVQKFYGLMNADPKMGPRTAALNAIMHVGGPSLYKIPGIPSEKQNNAVNTKKEATRISDRIIKLNKTLLQSSPTNKSKLDRLKIQLQQLHLKLNAFSTQAEWEENKQRQAKTAGKK